MYADTDFLIALIKDDDWLKDNAEEIYKEHQDEIWTSRYVMLELLMVSYRENWSCTEVLANIEELIEIRHSIDDLFEAAVTIEKEGMTPMDAIHLISSGKDRIISSDKDYDKHSKRVKLEEKE